MKIRKFSSLSLCLHTACKSECVVASAQGRHLREIDGAGDGDGVPVGRDDGGVRGAVVRLGLELGAVVGRVVHSLTGEEIKPRS